MLVAVHQFPLAIRERRDARIRRNIRKDRHRRMAWMGSLGRSERGAWYPLTKQKAIIDVGRSPLYIFALRTTDDTQVCHRMIIQNLQCMLHEWCCRSGFVTLQYYKLL